MIKIRDTVCKNCCFAKWNKTGITQTGCHLSMLDNAEKAGLTVLDVYDNDKEFNVIKHRQCMYCRSKKWAKEKLKQYNSKNTKHINELLTHAEKELNIFFEAIVLTNVNTTFEEIVLSIDYLYNQLHKPNYVVVVRNYYNNIKPSIIVDYLKIQGFHLWKLENPKEQTCIERQGRQLINLCLHSKVHPYISTFTAGKYIPPDFFSIIRNKILKEFFQFGILTNSEDKEYNEPIHGIVIPKTIFNYYGNSISEIEQCLKKEQAETTITEIHKIIPTFRSCSQLIDANTD